MMEAVNTTESSFNLYQTTGRNIPEGSNLRCQIMACLIYFISTLLIEISMKITEPHALYTKH
jgi:hypothetical protein